MLLGLLVAAQVLYVLGVAGAGYATTALGQHIILNTRPIDPRDLLYGDFVRLNYAISEVPATLWRDPATPPKRRQNVYVLLAAGPDSLSTAIGVYPAAPRAGRGRACRRPDLPAAPRAGANQAVLRGWVSDVYARSLSLRYGLERYYVPEGSGLRLEKAGHTRPLKIRVSIAPWGQSRITAVEER